MTVTSSDVYLYSCLRMHRFKACPHCLLHLIVSDTKKQDEPCGYRDRTRPKLSLFLGRITDSRLCLHHLFKPSRPPLTPVYGLSVLT